VNCREAERLLDTFFDGELDGRLMREAALHITRCRACERELQEKENVQELLVSTIEAQIDEGDVVGIWNAVQAGVGSARPESAPESGWRLAAATSTVRGLLVGERPARVERGRETARRETRSTRYRSLSVGAISAIAAAAAMFLFLGDGSEEEAARTFAQRPQEANPIVAEAGSSARRAPRGPIDASTVAVADGRRAVDPRVAGDLMAQAKQAAAKGGASRQVQIDSLEHSGGAMAMWSEPSAAVIWIGESDPRPASAPTPR